MANYTAKTSFVVNLGEAANEFIMRMADEIYGYVTGDSRITPSDDAIELAEAFDAADLGGVGASIMREKDGSLWFQSNEHPNFDLIAEIIRTALERHDLDDIISFQWSQDCDRPVRDAFGGGLAVIKKDEVFIETTQNIADQIQKKWENQQEPTHPTP